MSDDSPPKRSEWHSERMRIRHRERLLELGVFLLLFLPSLILSLITGPDSRMGFTLTAVAAILRNAGLVALILYFLRRNREPRDHIGWTGGRWPREAALGLILYVPTVSLTVLLRQILTRAGLPGPDPTVPEYLSPRTPAQMVLAFVLVIAVAVGEETVFRGYLIHRFREATTSTWLAVLVSTAIFAAGHAYESPTGMIGVGFMGLLLALIFLWRRSLVAVITIHFLQNFLALILLPLLRG